MPVETGIETMGSVHGATVETGSDGLKIALEKEMFGFLREQNLQLQAENERLKKIQQHGIERSEPGHGDSFTSWSEVGGDGSSGLHGGGMKGCKTPRKDKLLDGACRFTPNGTRVPDTSPPMDAQPVPQAPPLPPVPPFPAFPESGQRVEQFLDGYERTKGSDQKGKLGDRQWKPNEVDQKSLKGISSHELSPSEAREVWLEREVQSLRSVLDRMADQTSFKSSPYWSQGFQSGAPNQVSVMRASGDRDDTRAQHSLSSAFEVPHDDRAQHSSSGVADLLHAARVLNGASSAPALPLQRCF